MNAVILAGGFGTRLRSRVSGIPKPMAPIAGKPFLQYLLDRLVREGITEVVLSVGYLGELIEQYFGDQYHGMRIQYALETSPLGTGGALQFAVSFLPDAQQPVLALNGDTFLDLNYRSLFTWFETAGTDVGMVLRRIDNASRYGRVEVCGQRISGFLEKGSAQPGLINTGVYILRTHLLSALELLPPFSLELDVFAAKQSILPIAPYISDGYFIDIGVPEDFDRAQIELPRRFHD
jgi:D-glycero-alpha-D-manno-heptose 1-phosphate guanylyltransferase